MFSAAPSCRSASSSLCRQVAMTLHLAASLCCWLREAEKEKFPSPTSNIDPCKDMCNPNENDMELKINEFSLLSFLAVHCFEYQRTINACERQLSPLNFYIMAYDICVDLTKHFSSSISARLNNKICKK